MLRRVAVPKRFEPTRPRTLKVLVETRKRWITLEDAQDLSVRKRLTEGMRYAEELAIQGFLPIGVIMRTNREARGLADLQTRGKLDRSIIVDRSIKQPIDYERLLRLILSGAGPHANVNKNTVCHSICTPNYADSDRERSMELVILFGADINARNGSNQTPLMYAANNGYTTMVRLLLDRGANIEASDGNDLTPLMHAVIHDRVETVRLLLDRRAEVNARTGLRVTSLMRAAMLGYTETVRLLLARGADANIIDAFRKTAHDCAKTDEIKAMLDAAIGSHATAAVA